MSMSTHVVGFAPPDEQWKKMKAIWDSCDEAGIDPPEKVSDYFDGCDPDPSGIEVDLDNILEEYSSEGSEGYQLKVKDIPKKVKILRFINSY